MKKAFFCITFLLLAIPLFVGCAKRGSPEGGPKDEEPPRFIRATPENFTTNFNAEEIEIYFDEYVKLNETQRQVIISPPMEPAPQITPLGAASKSIKIKINDTLQPNTTYTINFGRSIIDNNEGNPLEFFRYIFSTGSYIDSLSISGTVSDAYLKEPDPFISVMLYEVDSTYTDSAVYNRPPRYITNTLDSAVTFQLQYLKEGRYQLVALKDANNNYTFEPETDKIAFLEDFITVPTDSVFHLNLFSELGEFTFAPRPSQVARQHLIFGYEGKLEPDSLQISLLPPIPEDFVQRITKDRETDTLHYWYKPTVERDSLYFVVETPSSKDTLLARLEQEQMELDSLQISFQPSGTVNFNQKIKILPTTPLAQINDSLLTLIDIDSVAVPFTTEYDAFENFVMLDFEKTEENNYIFQALPGAFTGFFGVVNDTLQAQFQTQAYSDYGSVTVNLLNVEQYPIIVQLTNEAGEIQAEQYGTSESNFIFEHLPPASYYIRIIYDENENRVWDTGNYLLEKQPEEVIYFPEAIDVRSNFYITKTFTL